MNARATIGPRSLTMSCVLVCLLSSTAGAVPRSRLTTRPPSTHRDHVNDLVVLNDGTVLVIGRSTWRYDLKTGSRGALPHPPELSETRVASLPMGPSAAANAAGDVLFAPEGGGRAMWWRAEPGWSRGPAIASGKCGPLPLSDGQFLVLVESGAARVRPGATESDPAVAIADTAHCQHWLLVDDDTVYFSGREAVFVDLRGRVPLRPAPILPWHLPTTASARLPNSEYLLCELMRCARFSFGRLIATVELPLEILRPHLVALDNGFVAIFSPLSDEGVVLVYDTRDDSVHAVAGPPISNSSFAVAPLDDHTVLVLNGLDPGFDEVPPLPSFLVEIEDVDRSAQAIPRTVAEDFEVWASPGFFAHPKKPGHVLVPHAEGAVDVELATGLIAPHRLSRPTDGGALFHTNGGRTVVVGSAAESFAPLGADGSPTEVRSDRVVALDAAGEDYVALAQLKTPRHEPTVAELGDGSLLVIGGERYDSRTAKGPFAGPRQRGRASPEETATALVEVERIDLRRGTATSGLPLKDPRARAASSLVDGAVLVTGGRRGSNQLPPESSRSDASCGALCLRICFGPPDTGTITFERTPLLDEIWASTERGNDEGWSAGPSLLGPRMDHAQVTLDDGRVLVIGGLQYGDRGRNPRAAIPGIEILDVGASEFRGEWAAPIVDEVLRAILLDDGRVAYLARARKLLWLVLYDPRTSDVAMHVAGTSRAVRADLFAQGRRLVVAHQGLRIFDLAESERPQSGAGYRRISTISDGQTRFVTNGSDRAAVFGRADRVDVLRDGVWHDVHSAAPDGMESAHAGWPTAEIVDVEIRRGLSLVDAQGRTVIFPEFTRPYTTQPHALPFDFFVAGREPHHRLVVRGDARSEDAIRGSFPRFQRDGENVLAGAKLAPTIGYVLVGDRGSIFVGQPEPGTGVRVVGERPPLTDVCSFDETLAYIVGKEGTLLALEGETLTPIPLLGAGDLVAVACSGRRTAYAIEEGRVWRFDGTAAHELPSPSAHALRDVAALSPVEFLVSAEDGVYWRRDVP